jgi:hypothetical protein
MTCRQDLPILCVAAGELDVAQDAQQARREELDGTKSMVRSGCRRYWS